MEKKTVPAFVTKAYDDEGIVDCVFALFGNVDEGKDRMWPGSFTKTFAERGLDVKVLDAHNTSSCLDVIGRPLELRELGEGDLPAQLKSKCPEATGGAFAKIQFLMDTPEGMGVFKRLKAGALNEWSFGYDALDFDYEDVDTGGEKMHVRNLRTVKLYEVSPVIWGLNPDTMTLGAKADQPSEGKPAPDVTENTIRIRVRDPGDFQDDAFGDGEQFRTIAIGDESQGIQAVIGKPKGENSTEVQSYVFQKDKWSVEKAQAWVDEHKKDGVPDADEKQMTEENTPELVPTDEQPYVCECVDCGYQMLSAEHCRDVKCPECGGQMRRAERPGPGKSDDWPTEVKFTGSPRNPYGTHASRGYPGGHDAWVKAWRVHLSKVRDQGPVQGTVRRVSMIAAGMKPPCKIPEMSAEDLTPRPGACGPLSGSYREKPSDYGLSQWKTPGDDDLEQEDIQLTCRDLTDLKRICLQEIAKRQQCREEEEGKGAEGNWGEGDSPQSEGGETKEGRVLSSANARKIVSALTTLLDVLERAGVDVPGYDKQPSKTPPKSGGKSAENVTISTGNATTGADGTVAEEEKADPVAGPAEPPTMSEQLRLKADLLGLDLMEIEHMLKM